MEASGNGKTETCVRNLLLLFQNEVPYSRKKGVNFANINKPLLTVQARLATESRKMIEEFEPRASVTNIEVTEELAKMGYLQIKAEATDADE